MAENDKDIQDSPFFLLPEEMFLHICSFLDVTDLVVSLSRVCRKFYCILQDENIWKSRVAARWGRRGRQYPIIEDNERPINWKEACFSLENDFKTWRKGLRKVVTTTGHVSDVDALLFIDGGLKCLTGSRDRSIVVWDVSTANSVGQLGKYFAHDGWIWKLKNFGSNIYSTSWDCSIKLWNLDVDLKQKQQFKCSSAVLSISVGQNGVIYGGCFNRIDVFDPRTKNTPIYTLECNLSLAPVLTIDEFEGDLVSGCENKSLLVWDHRTRSLKQTVELSGKNYPVSSQVFDHTLYVGDRKGKIRLFTNDKNGLSEKSKIDIGCQKPLSTIRVSRGSIVAASYDEVKVSLPLRPTFPVVNFSNICGLICGMDSHNGRLAVGTGSTVEFWIPEE